MESGQHLGVRTNGRQLSDVISKNGQLSGCQVLYIKGQFSGVVSKNGQLSGVRRKGVQQHGAAPQL